MAEHLSHDEPQPRLGIDIGRVIIGVDTDNPQKSIFGSSFLHTPAVEGAIETISGLVDSGVWEEVHLVSKCKPEIQERTLEWLKFNEFHEITGVPKENVHFCLERHEKAAIAARLALTHFIDDREDVLMALDSSIVKIQFSPIEFKPNKFMHIVDSWSEVETVLDMVLSGDNND